MRYYFFILVFCIASLTVNANDTTLHAGVYRNSDNTFTLRWNTNDKTLTNSPLVVGLGSSTLAGYLLSYPDRLGDKISAWLTSNTSSPTWINLAVAGYASANLMPASKGGTTGTNIDSALNSNPDFMFISLPTNDVANGLTNAEIMANLRYLDALALNNGVPIFWETTQPRTTFNATLQTQLKVLADSIRAAWPTRYIEGFNNVVNTAASTDAEINPVYGAGDGVHLNSAGNQFIADSLFARWLQYFQAVTGVYIIETSSDGSTWSTFDTVTDTVKKTYSNSYTTTQYFRVRTKYTNGTYSAYSNIVTLAAASSSASVRVRNTNRILVDLGGDGVNTVLPSGTVMGQPTASPDAYGNYWNNWYGSGGSAGFRDGATISQLLTTGDSTTTISMKIIGTPDGTYNSTATTRGINNNGFSVGVDDYPATALSDNMFLYNSINPDGVILRIKGLSQNRIYNFKLWGARVDASSTPRILETRLAAEDWSAAKSIETRYSTSASPEYDRAINYTGVSGVDSLDIYLRVGTGSTFASLSLVDITFGKIDTVAVCEGGSVTLTTSNTASAYQWQQNTGSGYVNISGATSATYTLNNALLTWSGYRYRCVANNDSSEVHYLLVNSTITPTITISGTTAMVQNTTTTLSATITNGGTSPTYQWMDSTSTHTWAGISNAVNNTLTYTPAKTGDEIRCILTSNLTGCLSTSQVTSNQLTFKVDVITTDTVTVCEGTTLTLSYINTASSFQWQQNTGSGYVNISGANTSTLSLNNSLLSWSGYRYRCMADDDSTAVHYLKVNAAATPVITITGTTSVRQYVSTILTSTISNGGTYPFYQWMDSTNTHTWANISEATADTISYTPKKTGDKILCLLTSSLTDCLTASQVSSNQLTFNVDVITAVDPDPTVTTGPRLYPNPAYTSLTIDQLSNWKLLEIYGMDGKTYLRREDMLTKTSLALSVSDLPNGMYIVVLTKANGITNVMKFIKSD